MSMMLYVGLGVLDELMCCDKSWNLTIPTVELSSHYVYIDERPLPSPFYSLAETALFLLRVFATSLSLRALGLALVFCS